MSIYTNKVRLSSRSKQPIGPIAVAVHMIPVLLVILILFMGPQVFGLHTNYERMYISLIVIIIMAWFTPTILAYLSRIVPFLWWAYRFRTKEEKKQAVLLHEMLPYRRMMWELLVYMSGVSCMLCGLWLQSPLFIWIGLTTSFVAVCVYFFELSRVFRY
ncbi:hypothetical protein D3C85_1436230 [compost metagenome]